MTKVNKMMDQPIINEDVLDFLRNNQKQLSGDLKDLQDQARERRNPVIPHETVSYFIWLLDQLKPKKILEVGTAIGFSSSVFAKHSEATIQTIERNPDMVKRANKNIEEFGLSNRIEVLEGQAEDWLEKLPKDSVDMIFMDSAKAKYYDFFPDCMRVLQKDGVLLVDDVLQGGTILEPTEEIPRRVRTIHKKLNAFLDVVLDHPALISTILPLGDGLLLITKKEDFDFSFMRKED